MLSRFHLIPERFGQTDRQNCYINIKTRSSAVAERPLDASCLSVVSFNIQRSFLLPVTAASDLLVHTILLNSVLLSPIVSGDVQPKLPGQTPLGHNPPPCFLPSEGRFGSGSRLVGRIGSGVRDSVSFRQKYPPGSVLRCPTAKIAVFTYRSPHFCFPWRRPCDYHVIGCMVGKTIQCLPNPSQHVPIYLQ